LLILRLGYGIINDIDLIVPIALGKKSCLHFQVLNVATIYSVREMGGALLPVSSSMTDIEKRLGR